MSEFFSTIGGVVTKDEAYRKLQHHLEEAQNNCLVIGHLFNTEDDNRSKLMAKGWHGVAEMIEMMRRQVREIMLRRQQ